MSDTAIRVDNLGKMYHIGAAQKKYPTLRDAIVETATAPFVKAKRLLQGQASGAAGLNETLWALKDVSFEVKRGEVLGIIGRNGAGKSTLLKVLSRITEPTEGQAEVHGRVASLLEVGTGFHPELTGRENIYMNGAILGMRRADIRRKFDSIVAFAEIEKFIDTPVKHFSSGMYTRLAFAVAAHLEPDILVIDEVLAVGDAEFQKKCLGKMRDVANTEGRTVLFVSHNMLAVQALCSRGLSLRDGHVSFDGDIQECVARYTQNAASALLRVWESSQSPPRLHIARIAARLEGAQPKHDLYVEVDLASRESHLGVFVAVDIFDMGGAWIMQAIPSVTPFIEDVSGTRRITVRIELPPLIPGEYMVGAWIGSHFDQTVDWVRDAVLFEVTETPQQGRTIGHSSMRGYIAPISEVVSMVGLKI